MATRPWLRLSSSVGQAPPPPPAPPVQPEPPAAPQPRPAFGRGLTFRPTVAPPPLPPPPTAPPPPPPSPPRSLVSAPAPPPPPTATPPRPPVSAPSPPPPRSPPSAPKSPPAPPRPAPSTVAGLPPATAPPSLPIRPVAVAPPPPPRTALPPPLPPPARLILLPFQQELEGERGDETNIPEVAEQKTVLTQETVEKPKAKPSFKAFITGDHAKKEPTIRAQNGKVEDGGTKKKGRASESEDAGISIVTLAGENQGAIMELGGLFRRSSTKNGNHRAISDGVEEGKGKHHHKEKGKSEKTEEMPMKAFANSNVQGVNNCIVCDASYSHHDPGVHLSLFRKPTANGGGGGHGFDAIKHGGPVLRHHGTSG